jgi:hypothetical protein
MKPVPTEIDPILAEKSALMFALASTLEKV